MDCYSLIFQTYMSKKIKVMVWITKSPIFPSTNYLQYNHTKAEHIRFDWKRSMNSIFRRHITTAQKDESSKREVKKQLQNEKPNKFRNTYYVPITLFVFASSWSRPNVLAIPKSDIFGFMLSSRRTLLVFRSLWMIFSLESWWR